MQRDGVCRARSLTFPSDCSYRTGETVAHALPRVPGLLLAGRWAPAPLPPVRCSDLGRQPARVRTQRAWCSEATAGFPAAETACSVPTDERINLYTLSGRQETICAKKKKKKSPLKCSSPDKNVSNNLLKSSEIHVNLHKDVYHNIILLEK